MEVEYYERKPILKGGLQMAVIPKPASTVVLMDDSSSIYLTRRPQSMKFMGGYYVFPGGGVEEEDVIHDTEFIIDENIEHSFERSHYIAAARELFEEAGVLLCKRKDGTTVVLSEDSIQEYRRRLLNGEISFLHILMKEEIYLHLESLTYIGHIITPSLYKIRFDTRFFLARLPKGQTPKPDTHEISDTIWLSPEEALSAYESDKILLAPPTIHVLKTMVNYLNGGPLKMTEFNVRDYKIIL